MLIRLLNLRRRHLLLFVAGLVALIAVGDWAVGNRMSLGVLYVLPMMLGAVVLGPPEIFLLATLCSSLRSWFDLPSPHIEMLLRFIFALISYFACGLIVAALIRNREVEEQLSNLVESSPAAILTISGDGIVIAANNAASQIFGVSGGESMTGRSIAGYLPVLSDALEGGFASVGLRTAAQCPGRRENGEIFLANTWFSSYATDTTTRLAAIVVDSSEEMREQEEDNLRQLMRGNRIAAAAVSHEVRNLCSAISSVSLSLREKYQKEHNDELQALESLVRGLERVSAIDLQAHREARGGDDASEDLQDIPLQAVLDDLRIVIESDWREIDGTVRWMLPQRSPRILADRQGLLQAFLNLAQNSHRAVRESNVRELRISVEADERNATVRFRDSGPGIAFPDRLFRPFHPGADGSGLGLYISRAVIRGYGGELRYEQRPDGWCFAIELQVVPPDRAADTLE